MLQEITDPAGLFAELGRLGMDPADFVVCGSAVLFVRGLRARIGDLDILARRGAWRAALRLADPVPAVSGHGQAVHHPRLPIEIVDRWTKGWDTDDLIENADVIDGVRFMPLRHLYTWKQQARRPKDLPDLAAITRLYHLWRHGTPEDPPEPTKD
ncbi:MAG TPA: hypothetical protein VL551_22045 [Actinospica sp.]|nr:hypothetical protein [Actinospica sp.]